MSKIVLIQSNPPPGFHFHGEAHRLWPASAPVRVEVLDQEDDPPEVPAKRRRGDEEHIELAPDPNKIGRRSFRALQGNPRIRILSDGETVASAESAAARGEADKLRAENAFLRSEIANWEVENDQLKAQILELQRATGTTPTALPKPVAEQGIPISDSDETVVDETDEDAGRAKDAGKTKGKAKGAGK